MAKEKKIEGLPPEPPGKYAATPANLHFNELAFVKTERSKWKLLSFGLLVIVIGLMVTINILLPLKSVSLYRVEVDEIGTTKLSQYKVSDYRPSDVEIRARLKELCIRMFSLDAKLTRSNLKIAEKFMAGQAKTQFNEWLAVEKPFALLTENDTHFKEVKVSGVSKIQEQVFLADINVYDRVGKSSPTVKRKSITFQIELIPPTTDADVLGDNPTGVYVTNFTISEIQ